MKKIKISKKDKSLRKLLQKTKPLFGNNRSFSCRATKRSWKPNIQRVKIDNKTYRLSAGSFRSIKKIKTTSSLEK